MSGQLIHITFDKILGEPRYSIIGARISFRRDASSSYRYVYLFSDLNRPYVPYDFHSTITGVFSETLILHVMAAAYYRDKRHEN